MAHLIQDPYFRCEIDRDASSPAPQVSIWRGQHQCVIEGFSDDEEAPSSFRAGEVIIKHQLQGDRGHYSVLRMAYLKLNFAGFPHNVVAQITRHQDSAFLVQSNRYTGDRFIKVARGELQPEEVFYWRPVGKHFSREGFYERTEEMNLKRKKHCLECCQMYAEEIAAGVSYEDARGLIPYDFRQNFTMAGDLQAVFHWVDQRSKADSQLEVQTLTAMAFTQIKEWVPELASWYEQNRYGKARLAP